MQPLDFEKYKKWLEKEFPEWPLKKAEMNFHSVTQSALVEFSASPFIASVRDELSNWNDLYYREKKGYYLFPISVPNIELQLKTFNSALDKTFRKNVINNPQWDKEPDGGWISPENWFESIHDLVRTQIIVKYMDGVEYLVQKLIQLSESLGVKHTVELEARSAGYYAAHFYIYLPFTIPTLKFDPKQVVMQLEIQITTQLQDAISKLTHERYVFNRSRQSSDESWRWDYQHENFKPSYLAHVLHFIEGMILEIRDQGSLKSKGEKE